MKNSWLRKYLPIFIISLTITSFAEEKKEKDYKEYVLLEDFESIKITNQSFRIQANTNYLPDVRMSKTLISPDLISNTSLLIRIPREGTGIPIDLFFPKPYSIEEYIIEFEFYVYSNQASGELFMYLLDTHFQKHQIRIANLNFDGWKNFKIQIGNKISQRNYILEKPSSVKLVGLQLNLTKKETKEREDIIAIDDIFIIKRKKYELPQEGLEIFH